eukprot:c1077_g1_i1.p1 GENE.c1077_g1_i1~~c1077_g1_i1.p1  ORF type:complete len:235 (+),score=54.73 c1077_g1_i1:76-705(+)
MLASATTINNQEPASVQINKISQRIGLSDLVDNISQLLVGEIRVDVASNENVRDLMQNFSTEVDDSWRAYALFDEVIPYTRNLVAAGDDYDLIMICWNPHKRSQIHDHPGSNCWLRVVQGTITERLFANGENFSVVPTKVSGCAPGYLAYINDSLGLHQVCNDTDEPAISLHLYCPRHTQCTVYNDQTGIATRKNCGFYSVFGERVQSM